MTRQPDAHDEDGSPLHEITPPNVDDVMQQKEPLSFEAAKRLVEHHRATRQNWNVKKAKERKRKEAKANE